MAITTPLPAPGSSGCSPPRSNTPKRSGVSHSTLTPASDGITPTASSPPSPTTGSSARSPPALRRTSSDSRSSTPSPTATARSAPPHLTAALALHDYAARSASWALTGATGQPLAEQIHAALRAHPAGLTRSQTQPDPQPQPARRARSTPPSTPCTPPTAPPPPRSRPAADPPSSGPPPSRPASPAGPLPLRASGSHREPDHAGNTEPSREPRHAPWRAIKARGEAGLNARRTPGTPPTRPLLVASRCPARRSYFFFRTPPLDAARQRHHHAGNQRRSTAPRSRSHRGFRAHARIGLLAAISIDPDRAIRRRSSGTRASIWRRPAAWAGDRSGPVPRRVSGARQRLATRACRRTGLPTAPVRPLHNRCPAGEPAPAERGASYDPSVQTPPHPQRRSIVGHRVLRCSRVEASLSRASAHLCRSGPR